MSLSLQLLLLFFVGYFFYYQSTDLNRQNLAETQTKGQQNANLKSSSEGRPGQSLKKLSLTEYKANSFGQKDWKLFAESANSDSANIEWSVADAEVQLFNQNLKVVTISSSFGEVNTKTKNIVFKDKVRSETVSGYRFDSLGLVYDSSKEKFYSDSQIEIVGPNNSTFLKGTSYEGDLRAGKMFIKGPIYCEQAIPDYEKPIIKSQDAIIDIEKRHVVFTGQVLILVGDMTITAKEAEFEYNKEKGDLEVLVLRGQVFASQKNQSAAAEILEIRVKNGYFLFQGNPRFVSGENTLVGNEILLFNKGKNVQILNGKVKSESEIEVK
jgi:LPS export ABC transporter protein LptC